uniref:Putative transmembrane protein n=1 Tax=Toxoplasma gondii COUG TaxID=1074873 RepID=A0A2G8XYJ1_TOXGO|nr:putative transmembrane protein [Toxoplasma gondii COUG]
MMWSRGAAHGQTNRRQGETEVGGSEENALVTETDDAIKTSTGTGEGQAGEAASGQPNSVSLSSVSSYSFSVVDGTKGDEHMRDDAESKKEEEAEDVSNEACAQSEDSMSSFDVLSSNVEDDSEEEDDDGDTESPGDLSDCRTASSSFGCTGADARTRPRPNSQARQSNRGVSSSPLSRHTLHEDLSGGATDGDDSGEGTRVEAEGDLQRNRDRCRSVDDGQEGFEDCVWEGGARGESPQNTGAEEGSDTERARSNEQRLSCKERLQHTARDHELGKNLEMCVRRLEHRKMSGEAKEGHGANAVEIAANGNTIEEEDGRDDEGDVWMELGNRTGFSDMGESKSIFTEDEKKGLSRNPMLSDVPASQHDAPVEKKVQRLQRVIDELREETEGKLTCLREKSEKLEALLYALVPSVSRVYPPYVVSSFESSTTFPFRLSPAALIDPSATRVEPEPHHETNCVQCRSFDEMKMPSFASSASPIEMRTRSLASNESTGNERRETSVLPGPGTIDQHDDAAKVERGKPSDAGQFSFKSAPSECGESSYSWRDALKVPSSPSSFFQKDHRQILNTNEADAADRTTKKGGLSDVEICGSHVSSEALEGRACSPRCETDPQRGKALRDLGGVRDGGRAATSGNVFSFAGSHVEGNMTSLIEADQEIREARQPVASVLAFFNGPRGHSDVYTHECGSGGRHTDAPWVTKLRKVGARLVLEATSEKRESQAMLQEDGDVTETEESESEEEMPDGVEMDPAAPRGERVIFSAANAESVEEDEGYAFLEDAEGEEWTRARYKGLCATMHAEWEPQQRDQADAVDEKTPDAREAQFPLTEKRFVYRYQERNAKGDEKQFELTEDGKEGNAFDDNCSCSPAASVSSSSPPSPRAVSWLADFLPFLNPLSYPVRFLARVLGLNVDGSFDRWRLEIQRGSVRGTVVLGVIDATVCVGLVMGLVYFSFFVSRMVFKTVYVHVHAIEEEKVPHYFEGLTYKFWGKKPIYFSDVPGERESGWITQRVNWYRPHGY